MQLVVAHSEARGSLATELRAVLARGPHGLFQNGVGMDVDGLGARKAHVSFPRAAEVGSLTETRAMMDPVGW